MYIYFCVYPIFHWGQYCQKIIVKKYCQKCAVGGCKRPYRGVVYRKRVQSLGTFFSIYNNEHLKQNLYYGFNARKLRIWILYHIINLVPIDLFEKQCPQNHCFNIDFAYLLNRETWYQWICHTKTEKKRERNDWTIKREDKEFQNESS